MGLGAVFSTKPYFIESEIPFLIIILTNILIFGALYGIFYGIFLAIKNKKAFVEEFKKINRDEKLYKLRLYLVCLTIFVFLMNMLLINDLTTKLVISFVLILAVLYPYLIIFVKSVEYSSMYNFVSVKKLTEGDWVEQDIKIKGKIIYKKKKLGIEKHDIEKLIRYKIKKVLVKQGIPFVPPIFLGLLFTIIVGKIVLLP